MKAILIRTDQPTSRLDYICTIIFTNFLGVPFRISSKDDIKPGEVVLNYYMDNQIREGLNIFHHGLLSERGILPQSIEIKTFEGRPCFFYDVTTTHEVPFDIFSFSFFLLTRYEEYFSKDVDQYGRFKGKNSLAVQNDFIHVPLVDLWIKWLAELIKTRYNTDLAFTGSYRKLVTFDVDLPYAFRGKPSWKVIGGLFKDLFALRGGTLLARLQFLIYGKDPFDTYDWIRNQCSPHQFEVIFFLLNRNNPPRDENHLANTPEIKAIMQELQKWTAVGIHPSLTAGNDAYKIVEEKGYLIKHLDQPVFKSRQHYLRLRMPDTYRALIASGMEQDYSMGYPEFMGFRASTARPFLWYDLMNEYVTNLTVYPCMTMDATMRYYERLRPDTAIKKCKELIRTCQEVNGTFCFIWHNSSLSKAYGWGPWKKVFESLAQD